MVVARGCIRRSFRTARDGVLDFEKGPLELSDDLLLSSNLVETKQKPNTLGVERPIFRGF